MIDLSLIKGVSVDPAARLARAAAAATWGEFDLATQRYGLATTGGTVSPRVRGSGLEPCTTRRSPFRAPGGVLMRPAKVKIG